MVTDDYPFPKLVPDRGWRVSQLVKREKTEDIDEQKSKDRVSEVLAKSSRLLNSRIVQLK